MLSEMSEMESEERLIIDEERMEEQECNKLETDDGRMEGQISDKEEVDKRSMAEPRNDDERIDKHRFKELTNYDQRLNDQRMNDHRIDREIISEPGNIDHRINNHRIDDHRINNHRIDDHRINDHRINNHRINDHRINNVERFDGGYRQLINEDGMDNKRFQSNKPYMAGYDEQRTYQRLDDRLMNMELDDAQGLRPFDKGCNVLRNNATHDHAANAIIARIDKEEDLPLDLSKPKHGKAKERQSLNVEPMNKKIAETESQVMINPWPNEIISNEGGFQSLNGGDNRVGNKSATVMQSIFDSFDPRFDMIQSETKNPKMMNRLKEILSNNHYSGIGQPPINYPFPTMNATKMQATNSVNDSFEHSKKKKSQYKNQALMNLNSNGLIPNIATPMGVIGQQPIFNPFGDVSSTDLSGFTNSLLMPAVLNSAVLNQTALMVQLSANSMAASNLFSGQPMQTTKSIGTNDRKQDERTAFLNYQDAFTMANFIQQRMLDELNKQRPLRNADIQLQGSTTARRSRIKRTRPSATATCEDDIDTIAMSQNKDDITAPTMSRIMAQGSTLMTDNSRIKPFPINDIQQSYPSGGTEESNSIGDSQDPGLIIGSQASDTQQLNPINNALGLDLMDVTRQSILIDGTWKSNSINYTQGNENSINKLAAENQGTRSELEIKTEFGHSGGDRQTAQLIHSVKESLEQTQNLAEVETLSNGTADDTTSGSSTDSGSLSPQDDISMQDVKFPENSVGPNDIGNQLSGDDRKKVGNSKKRGRATGVSDPRKNDPEYVERRMRNNNSARKSRETKKLIHERNVARVKVLDRENEQLRTLIKLERQQQTKIKVLLFGSDYALLSSSMEQSLGEETGSTPAFNIVPVPKEETRSAKRSRKK